MATQEQVIVQLTAVLAQQKKTAGEIAALQASMDVLRQQIADLQTAAGNASDELVAAVQAVAEQAQITDDLIPDAPVTPLEA